MKDYYKILHVPESSTQETIKAAFRRLAMKWHPDRNKNEASSTKFKEINEAYSVLGDEAKRQEYDQSKKLKPWETQQ